MSQRNRISRKGKKLVATTLPTTQRKAGDLCREKFELLKDHKNAMRRFNEYVPEFIKLPWEEKKNKIVSFLEKYGFKDISFPEGEFFFKFKEQSVVTMSNHDIDAMFAGLESAFRRLEELEPELL